MTDSCSVADEMMLVITHGTARAMIDCRLYSRLVYDSDVQ